MLVVKPFLMEIRLSLRLPSRYEDLDTAFRGRLKPNQPLLALVKQAFTSMDISGGIRFLPIFGKSGSGKTSATLEIGTHLPDLFVSQLPRSAIDDPASLGDSLEKMKKEARGRKIVAVIDQYEEVAAQRTAIPSAFVEAISIMDRSRGGLGSVLFIWLTTSREFQSDLSSATSRNQRILISSDFELEGISSNNWPPIIEETFQFHNQDKTLSDFEILERDMAEISDSEPTIGSAIERVGVRLSSYVSALHDLSTYTVVMLWPVTDGLRISRVQQFTDARQGYKLDWNAWYRQMNSEDQQQLPVREYNRARLYFDMRLVPIAAADLHPLCRDLENNDFSPGQSYLDRFENTHFFSIVSGKWNPDNFAPLRERESS
ncbi:hypothetical protein [Bosea sp. NPDC055594]